jgi:3-isopropylmalate dehydrogenase
MLLETIGEAQAAQRVENAVMKVCANHMKSMAAGKMGHTTEEVGDLVVKNL